MKLWIEIDDNHYALYFEPAKTHGTLSLGGGFIPSQMRPLSSEQVQPRSKGHGL